MADQPQQLNCNIREYPDGSKRLIFVLAPQGQYIGELRIECADLNVLPAIAATFQNWANAQKPALQLAPASAIGQLDKVNGRAHS